MTHETTPTHIYEVMFEDSILDKEERISVHLTRHGAELSVKNHSAIIQERDKNSETIAEDYSWYIKTTPILP